MSSICACPDNEPSLAVSNDSSRLEALVQLNDMSDAPLTDILDFTLEEALHLTHSGVGYIYFYDETTELFTLYSWSKNVMRECTVAEKQTVYALCKTGVWGEAVRQRKAILINDFTAKHPLKKGYPSGHVPLNNFLTIPVFQGTEIRGVVGVGNKDSDYTNRDIEQLNLFMKSVWNIVRRKQSDEKLRKAYDKLEERVKERTRELEVANTDLLEEIAKRSSVETKLRKALAFNEKILAHSSVGIGVFDGTSGRCLLGNPVLGDIFGVSHRRVLSQNFRKLEAWQKSGLLNLAEAVLAGEGPKRIDLPVHIASGRDAVFDCTLARVDADDSHCLLLIAADISERIRFQEVMVQTEKMMSVGGLAAGMAHEINNPLGGILQSVQVILRRLESASAANEDAAATAGCPMPSIRSYMGARDIIPLLQGIREAGTRAAKIVADMLEFSQKSESRHTPVDLNDLLDKAVALCANDYDLKKKFDFRQIIIEREYSRELPLVNCTATQIEQVVMNLLRNAAQAMAGRGNDGQASRLVLRTRCELETAVIEVEDNGPGMDETVRRKIFEPFFSTKPPGEGTGLGLSVSYFIITSNHKGSVAVASWPGKGTRFTIGLPLTEHAHALDHSSD